MQNVASAIFFVYAASLSVAASHLQLDITHQNVNPSHYLPHRHTRPANSSASGNLLSSEDYIEIGEKLENNETARCKLVFFGIESGHIHCIIGSFDRSFFKSFKPHQHHIHSQYSLILIHPHVFTSFSIVVTKRHSAARMAHSASRCCPLKLFRARSIRAPKRRRRSDCASPLVSGKKTMHHNGLLW